MVCRWNRILRLMRARAEASLRCDDRVFVPG